MKTYNKLVRDKIPQIIKESGKSPVVKKLSQKEYVKSLEEKLKEEVNEYLNSKNIEELADMQEVILAIAKSKGSSLKKLEKLRIQKAKERGSFSKRIKLIKVEP